jgi:glycerol kinase
VYRSPDATALGVAALARLGTGAAGSLAEAVGPATPQTVVEPAMSAGQAAQRLPGYEAALGLVLGGR